jgi:hypothetical protein
MPSTTWPTAPITSETYHYPCTTPYDDYKKRTHGKTDRIIDDGVLDYLDAIKVFPIEDKSEEDLAKELAQIANLSMALGYILEGDVGCCPGREEAYQQNSQSVSLFSAVGGMWYPNCSFSFIF